MRPGRRHALALTEPAAHISPGTRAFFCSSGKLTFPRMSYQSLKLRPDWVQGETSVAKGAAVVAIGAAAAPFVVGAVLVGGVGSGLYRLFKK